MTKVKVFLFIFWNTEHTIMPESLACLDLLESSAWDNDAISGFFGGYRAAREGVGVEACSTFSSWDKDAAGKTGQGSSSLFCGISRHRL